MSAFDFTLLKAMPEPVILADGGVVTDLNEGARTLFPGLAPGAALPEELAAAEGSGSWGGPEHPYTFSVTRSGSRRLILLHPAPAPALTDRQLDGTLRQLRSFLGEMLCELGSRTDPDSGDYIGSDFMKSFHRLFRLMDNADCLSLSARDGGLPFRPVTVDLVSFARRLCREAGELLADAGITLRFDCSETNLLTAADPALLQRMLLELISNGARAPRPDRTVVLSLARRGENALFAVSDNGGSEAAGRLAAALSGVSDDGLPLPGQGAGLGLALVRRIVSLHGGVLMADCGGPGPRLLVSLPCRRPELHVGLESPAVFSDGGLDPTLVALSDLLPSDSFKSDGMD